jgi:PAS domain S-box-containing protein
MTKRETMYDNTNIKCENIYALLDVSEDAAFLFNKKNELVMMNREALKRLKALNPELRDKPLSFFLRKEVEEYYPKEFLLEVDRCRKAVLKSGKSKKFRYKLRERTVEITAYPLFDKKNPDINFAVYSRDITKKVEAQAKAKQMEEELSLIIDNMHDGFLITDKKGYIIYANPIAERFTGYCKKDIIGKLFISFIPQSEKSKVMTYYKYLKNADNIRIESNIIMKDGLLKPMRLSATPIHDHKGRFNGTHIIASDISEIKKTETELKYQVEFSKKIIELSSHFINIKTSDIDRGINTALSIIGRFNNEDRIVLYILNYDNSKFLRTHEWALLGTDKKLDYPEELNLKDYPYLCKSLSNLGTIHVKNITMLHERIKEDASFSFAEKLGLKSFVIVPMVLNEKLIGFMGMGSKTFREWSENEISLMKTALGIIALAMERKNVEIELIDVILKRLSEREREFLNILAGGFRWPADKRIIAKSMDVLPGTLDKFMQRIKEKVRQDDLQLITEFLNNKFRNEQLLENTIHHTH